MCSNYADFLPHLDFGQGLVGVRKVCSVLPRSPVLLGDSFPDAAPCSGAALPWWFQCPARGKVSALAQRVGDPKMCVGGAHGRPILL